MLALTEEYQCVRVSGGKSWHLGVNAGVSWLMLDFGSDRWHLMANVVVWWTTSESGGERQCLRTSVFDCEHWIFVENPASL